MKGIIQTLRIVCPAAKFKLSQDAKERSSPIGSAPRVRVIESAISRLRETLRHVPNQVKPHLLHFEMSCLNPSDRLDIGGNALFDPVVLVVDGGKSPGNPFGYQHPIRRQLGRSSLLTDTYGDSPSSFAKCHAVADTSSIERSDPNQDSRHGKAAVIRRNAHSSRFDPKKNVLHLHFQAVSLV